MSQSGSAAAGQSVMRTFVRARVARTEFVRTMEGIGVCRMLVIGEAAGPASSPVQVSLYVRDGGGELREDEAKRCAFNLHEGDLIQAVGDLAPKRRRAKLPEVLVSEPVRLRARAAGTAGAA